MADCRQCFGLPQTHAAHDPCPHAGRVPCSSCRPDYCACHDHFTAYRAFHRGDYDHLRKPVMKTADGTSQAIL
jgi:hypothetical protein